VEWVIPGSDKKSAAPSRSYTIAGGDWQEVRVEIPTAGPLGILRVYLPAQRQPVEVESIEIKGTGAPRRWKF
jgi:hypothetical protein